MQSPKHFYPVDWLTEPKGECLRPRTVPAKAAPRILPARFTARRLPSGCILFELRAVAKEGR